MNRTLLALSCWITFASAFADSPAPPVPRVFTSESGSGVFFTMVPARHGKDFKVEREAFGVAYKMDDEGKFKELYRTEGWYSFSVFISRDGQYLVRMGPWSVGREPAQDDLAVAFYKDGKLLKEYSTAELVRDKSKVVATVSHYFWQAPSPLDDSVTAAERLRLRLHLGYDNEFQIHTIDGWTYTFDVTSGKIISREPTKK
ncbi:hypothetical protein [Prosthecobacter sp.]|uniref:hypothetical protein n=1 Tax=Prosthecobacter sp. TaxID=1965333 RepID=UPI001DFF37C2|nr:hypothetical protein [Prosthecobacter sp.]MCB1275268.1 hypothetical protein [Prosthecobacter sp.]